MFSYARFVNLLVHLLPKTELLNETLFSSLAEAREKIGAWKEDYNRNRPHSSLGNLTPQEFAMKAKLENKAA